MKKFLRNLKEDGISLRITYVVITVFIFILSIAILYKVDMASKMYKELSLATDGYITLTNAAEDLMAASDYLTQEVQLFTVTKDINHLNNYFKEANEVKRRENAIKTMGLMAGDSNAFQQLQLAYNASIKLMEREYYAMKLVLVACNINDYPEDLKDVELSNEDLNKSGERKLIRAQDMVHDTFYYKEKNIIRIRMEECAMNLEEETHKIQLDSEDGMRQSLSTLKWEIVLFLLAVLITISLTIILVISPLHKAVKKIAEDKPLKVGGGRELRSLARTYNSMYETQKENLKNLNFEATHDALTGLYNRAGYDYIKSAINHKSTAMILIDCDLFKKINDTMGHEAGDKILIKLSDALMGEFREEDYICRIGGDEFVVFMTNTDKKSRGLIREKIKNVNKVLHDTSDGLPDASISAGVVFGTREKNLDAMFKHADLTLYRMKEQRNGCAFYTE